MIRRLAPRGCWDRRSCMRCGWIGIGRVSTRQYGTLGSVVRQKSPFGSRRDSVPGVPDVSESPDDGWQGRTCHLVMPLVSICLLFCLKMASRCVWCPGGRGVSRWVRVWVILYFSSQRHRGGRSLNSISRSVIYSCIIQPTMCYVVHVKQVECRILSIDKSSRTRDHTCCIESPGSMRPISGTRTTTHPPGKRD